MAQKSAYIAEFVGAFILVFTVGCTVRSGTQAAGAAIGCSLMVGVYALGKISGANFNPAVSVALGFSKKLPWPDVATYALVQLLAGALAGLLAQFVYKESDPLALGPTKGFSWWQAGLCELIYTFMLCFVVLNTACSKAATSWRSQFYGLSIGLVIVAGAYGAGAVSGGCFNPAVALGVYTGSGPSADSLRCLPMYVLFELVGAALAAALFKVVRPESFENGEVAQLPARVTSEILGTYMLVLTVGLVVLAASPAGAFPIAASLIVMIFALGDVSGGHFNPAVTFAVLAIQKIELKDAAIYWGAQVFGGILAGLTYTVIYGGKSFALGPQENYGYAQVAIGEIFFTFVLTFLVCSVACSPSAEDMNYSQVFGLAIGSCVIVGGFAIGKVSGGSLNPAVSIGTFAVDNFNFKDGGIYALLELVGAGLAALVYCQTHGDSEADAVEKLDSGSGSDSDSDRRSSGRSTRRRTRAAATDREPELTQDSRALAPPLLTTAAPPSPTVSSGALPLPPLVTAMPPSARLGGPVMPAPHPPAFVYVCPATSGRLPGAATPPAPMMGRPPPAALLQGAPDDPSWVAQRSLQQLGALLHQQGAAAGSAHAGSPAARGAAAYSLSAPMPSAYSLSFSGVA